jgi:small nuclear ribonucleoprotein
MRPLEVLQQSLHKRVLVELRGGHSIRGVLDGFDQHLNLVLSSAVEVEPEQGGNPSADAPPAGGTLTLVRGDSVVFISP